MMNKTYEKGIYIHIPFCVHKCIYCDFLSAPAGDAVKYAYTKALINEIRNTADGQVKDKITSIFFGGGISLLYGAEKGDRRMAFGFEIQPVVPL